MSPLAPILENVSRRRFLGGALSTGAFIVASQVLPESLWAQDVAIRTRAQSAPLHPSIYLGIEPDGSVFIVTHRSEMGTGIRTSLPLVAADELDADWSRVRIEQGVGNAAYGSQNTDGSCSIRDFYDAFRRAGAAARSMLVSAAATKWGVPVAEITTEAHNVVHRGSGRRIAYGELVAAACGQRSRPLLHLHESLFTAACQQRRGRDDRQLAARHHTARRCSRERQGGFAASHA